MYAKKCDCPHRDIDEKNKLYVEVKEKIYGRGLYREMCRKGKDL